MHLLAQSKPTGIMESKRFDDDIWLLDRITQGSEYDLHLAFWPSENQRILIKSLRPTTDEVKRKKIESRLLKEASTLEEFWSPYFPKVYDIRRNSEGTLYLILEYFEGISLRQYLDLNLENGIKYKAAQKIDVEISHAIHYLHVKKKVIHFDLSPENIIISPENKVHIIDFEDAKIIGKSIAQNNIRGKAKYMAPELKASNTQVIALAYFDEFAKGVIFKEMLALCSPWDRLRNGSLFLPKLGTARISSRYSSIFTKTAITLGMTLVLLLGVTFGPFFKDKPKKTKNRVTTSTSSNKRKKRSSRKRNRVARRPAIPKVQIVKRRSSSVKKKIKAPLNFRQKFQKVVSTQDRDLENCLKPLNKKEITLGFVLEKGSGKLLKLKSKTNLSLDKEALSCLTKLYKGLKYPPHPSNKEVEVTQRFVIVNKT